MFNRSFIFIVILAAAAISASAQDLVGTWQTGGMSLIGDRNTVQSGKYNIKIDKASGLAIGDGARVERSGDDVER